jgi:hypothetical protein
MPNQDGILSGSPRNPTIFAKSFIKTKFDISSFPATSESSSEMKGFFYVQNIV